MSGKQSEPICNDAATMRRREESEKRQSWRWDFWRQIDVPITLASGARQFVVHDALDTMSLLAESYDVWNKASASSGSERRCEGMR